MSDDDKIQAAADEYLRSVGYQSARDLVKSCEEAQANLNPERDVRAAVATKIRDIAEFLRKHPPERLTEITDRLEELADEIQGDCA